MSETPDRNKQALGETHIHQGLSLKRRRDKGQQDHLGMGYKLVRHPESLEPLRKKVPVRSPLFMRGHTNKPPIQAFNAVLKQRPITGCHYFTTDVDAEISVNADQVFIKK
ncbi:MAG: hypothetical protein ACK4SX_10835 [Alcanivoracaceae bacterium]